MVEQSWLRSLEKYRAIAVIRAPEVRLGVKMAQAAAAGGIRLIEVTWTSGEAAKLVQELRRELPGCLIGAGTVLTLGQLQEAITAGAEFIFSPHTNLALIQAALAAGVPSIPGALSPTEIVTAWQAGASCVKVFPIQAVGGSSYLRSLRQPLGQIPLIPTGGVRLENAREFLEAGAIAVALSSQLFLPELLVQENWSGIEARAASLLQAILI